MKSHEIRQAIDGLSSTREKIDFLETLPEKRSTHFVLYTLASLYLEIDNPDKAESLLREDLRIGGDPCDRYESLALLMGLSMDQNRDIPDVEIGEMVSHFREMIRAAKEEIVKLKSGGAAKSEGSVFGDHLARERRKRFEIYLKDPYQLERMIGDYYYGKGEQQRAYGFYESYYRDLDKPVETFVPESARRYAGLLLKKGKTDEALFFTGYIITLKPYMFEDLFSFADLYYGLNDRISALLILMFAHALCEGYDRDLAEKSRTLVQRLGAEMEGLARGGQAGLLAGLYLSGERSPKMLRLIEGLKKEGIRNFFFSYLEGTVYFAGEEYPTALARFTEFNDAYPYLAESHYYQLVCMFKIDRELYARSIPPAAENAIELKPHSPLAEMAKIYLGLTFGLSESESPKLLIPAESGAILKDFVNRGSPVKVLDRLIGSLTIMENPYQTNLVQRLAKLSGRREEVVSYLRNVYDLLNDTGRKNIRRVLSGMGVPL
jgi:tetratricopeptide (TPR) repeat protein